MSSDLWGRGMQYHWLAADKVCHLVTPVFQFSCQQQGITSFEGLKQSGDAQSGVAGCSLVPLTEGSWFSALLPHFSTITLQYPVLGSFHKEQHNWIWFPDFWTMAHAPWGPRRTFPSLAPPQGGNRGHRGLEASGGPGAGFPFPGWITGKMTPHCLAAFWGQW